MVPVGVHVFQSACHASSVSGRLIDSSLFQCRDFGDEGHSFFSVANCFLFAPFSSLSVPVFDLHGDDFTGHTLVGFTSPVEVLAPLWQIVVFLSGWPRRVIICRSLLVTVLPFVFWFCGVTSGRPPSRGL